MLVGVASADPESDRWDALIEDARSRESLLSLEPEPEPAVTIGGLVQSRFNANILDQDDAQSVDDFETGFEMRRVRIKLNGELDIGDRDDSVPWEIELDSSRSSGSVFLLDAYVGYETGNWRFRAGQFVPPLTREPLVSNSRRMAVEVSPVTAAFSTNGAGGRTQGIESQYREGDWSVTVMLADGDRGGNRSFAADEGDLGLYTRIERKIGDDWGRFRDFTSKRGSEDAWLFGLAGLATVGETDADGDGQQFESFLEFIGTADISFEGNGWSAFAASNILHRSAQAVDDVNRFGVSGHVAAYVSDDVELFTQYSWMTGEADEGELSVLVAGFNKYIAGHALKFTADVGYSFNPITDAYASGSRALLEDAPGQDGQVFLRAQLQLVF